MTDTALDMLCINTIRTLAMKFGFTPRRVAQAPRDARGRTR